MPQPQDQKSTKKISIRYEKSEVIYATQFLASPSTEELLLDFSSGTLPADTATQQGESLPIHTRLAMPWSAVERLTKILNEVIDRRQELIQQKVSSPSRSDDSTVPQASLPRMSASIKG